jgi:putative ABC transport system substrate-binding protein
MLVRSTHLAPMSLAACAEWVLQPSGRDTLRPVVLKLREDQMKRREFIAATAVLLVSPRLLRAQGTPRQVGVLSGSRVLSIFKMWQEGLRDHGWIEGKNLIIDYRYFEGHAERIPVLAAELVALKPDLLVCSSPQTAVALKSATATIPIVFVAVADPVAIGLVQSLSHPGGNVTGLTSVVPGGFLAKQLEILRELIPSVSKIALLVKSRQPDAPAGIRRRVTPRSSASRCGSRAVSI